MSALCESKMSPLLFPECCLGGRQGRPAASEDKEEIALLSKLKELRLSCKSLKPGCRDRSASNRLGVNHKDPSSDPWHLHHEAGETVYIGHPRAREAETRVSLWLTHQLV